LNTLAHRAGPACCSAARAGPVRATTLPFPNPEIHAIATRVCQDANANWLHTARVEFMKKLVEIHTQEFLCRERARRDSERKVFGLKEAEEWEQRALDEIAFHFRECNLDSTDTRTAA
jgi:hypothetical protein